MGGEKKEKVIFSKIQENDFTKSPHLPLLLSQKYAILITSFIYSLTPDDREGISDKGKLFDCSRLSIKILHLKVPRTESF